MRNASHPRRFECHQTESITGLTYFRAVVQDFLRGDEAHLAVTLARHKYHTLGLDAAYLARCKVGQYANLLPDHILRRIVFSYARHYGSLVYSCIYAEFEELVCLRHPLGLKHGSGSDIHLLEVLETALGLLWSHLLGGFSLGGSFTLGAYGIQTVELVFYGIVLNLGEKQFCCSDFVAFLEDVGIAEHIPIQADAFSEARAA